MAQTIEPNGLLTAKPHP